ncbi:hypothetical protein [Streptomyces sp. TLI_55]|uniref:hypothetical protein n=1 Tax=Streptomyces sp. TLI_55 TaxID=1938861 RepID=UPI000BE275F4|nr:hypothetical protein [Streptomyces sp. TLI_55]
MAQLSAFKRLGEPEEVADMVVFLATDRARLITAAAATGNVTALTSLAAVGLKLPFGFAPSSAA